jgi:hypothetical protein
MLRTDCKKLYSLLRKKTTNMKNASSKKKMRTFGNKHMKEKCNIMKQATGPKNLC